MSVGAPRHATILQKQTSAHPDRAMDLPLRNGESSRAQSLLPTGYMLVDAIDERSIQVENNSRCFQELFKQKMGTALHGPQTYRDGLGGYPSRSAVGDALRQLSQLGVSLLLFFQSLLKRADRILQRQCFREGHERPI